MSTEEWMEPRFRPALAAAGTWLGNPQRTNLHGHHGVVVSQHYVLGAQRRLAAPAFDRVVVLLEPRREHEGGLVADRMLKIGGAFVISEAIALTCDVGPNFLAALGRDPGSGERRRRR